MQLMVCLLENNLDYERAQGEVLIKWAPLFEYVQYMRYPGYYLDVHIEPFSVLCANIVKSEIETYQSAEHAWI